MSEGQHPPPRPARIPQFVGEGELRKDVSGLNDRQVLVLCLDAILRTQAAARGLSDAFRTLATEIVRVTRDHTETSAKLAVELGSIGLSLQRLSMPVLRAAVAPGPLREEAPSSHEWDEMLVQAGRRLSARVKDGRDPMTSDRARDIAREVVEGVETAKDAKTFRTMKARGLELVWRAFKVAVPIVAAAVATFAVARCPAVMPAPTVHANADGGH